MWVRLDFSTQISGFVQVLVPQHGEVPFFSRYELIATVKRSCGQKSVDDTAVQLIKKTHFSAPPGNDSCQIQISFAGLVQPNKAVCLDDTSTPQPVFKPEFNKLALHREVKLGNIAPYRKDMLELIASNWHPSHEQNMELVVTVASDGKLLDRRILVSSGKDRSKLQKRIIRLLKNTITVRLKLPQRLIMRN